MNGPTFAAPVAAAPKATAPRPAARPAPPKPDADAGGLKIFTYLRLHWLMILFCGTLLGGGAAYLAWDLLASKYESYALLQVSSVPYHIANSGNQNQARTDLATFIKTNAALIKYEFVLNAALRDLRDVPTIKAQENPIKFLEEELQVSASDGSEVIRVTMKGHNPADVQKIVNAVQAAFMREVIERNIQDMKKFLGTVEQAKLTIQKTLESRKKGPKTGDVQPASGVSAPPPAGALPPAADPPKELPQLGVVPPIVPPKAVAAGPAGLPVETPFDRLLKHDPMILVKEIVALRAQIGPLPVQIHDAELQVRLLQQDWEKLKKAPIDPLTLAAVDVHPDVIKARHAVDVARHDYNFWLGSTRDFNAPGGADRKRKLERAEATLEGVRQEKVNMMDGPKQAAQAEKLKTALETAYRRLKALEEQRDSIKRQLASAESMLMNQPVPEPVSKAGFIGRTPDGKEFFYDPERTDLFAVDGVYSRLINQYEMTKLELDSPPRVRVLQNASSPTQKDMRKQIIGTVAAGLLGYGLLFAGVIAFETMTRRVSSLGDVKSAGPSAVVGVIPCQPREAVGRDPVKRAMANEAIDKLRAYVSQSWLARGASSVAVTSPLGDEGKAFTSFGLASSLAQAGYKTLLVDFDLRDPAVHAYAGVPNVSGVCELLRGEAEFASSVQFLPSGLHMVPAGKWSDEARKAATGGRLESLLARLKEPYDCVVINGHAILTAAESVEVARRCEVVLVCAQYRETTTPLLKRATDRVAALEIPYSGVVYVGATEEEALC